MLRPGLSPTLAAPAAVPFIGKRSSLVTTAAVIPFTAGTQTRIAVPLAKAEVTDPPVTALVATVLITVADTLMWAVCILMWVARTDVINRDLS